MPGTEGTLILVEMGEKQLQILATAGRLSTHWALDERRFKSDGGGDAATTAGLETGATIIRRSRCALLLRLRPRRQEALHEACVEVAFAEAGVLEDFLVEGDGGLDALHNELAERALHLRNRFGPVAAVDDQLGDERVVIGRNHAFGVLRRIDAHAIAAGHIEGRDLAG